MRILVLLFLFLFQGATAQRYTLKYNLKDSIKRMYQYECDQNKFSGVILVAHKGKPIYFQSSGYKDFDKKVSMKKTDIFELASVSKQFTSMIILMLQERGKLGFDDRLEHWIPELPFKGITIRNLLTHTSGLPDYQAIMDKHWDKSKVADNIDVIEYLKKYPEPVHFEPGEKYEYSNTGYLLLASIAEKASDSNFIQITRNWIFKPVQMKTADFRTPAMKQKIHNMAFGYIFDAAKNRYVNAIEYPESNYTIWLGNRKGPGRISANALDLLKWDQALYGPLLVSKTTMLEAYQPFKLKNGTWSNYGFGWELQMDEKLGRVVSHAGDNPGYKTHITRYIDQEYTFILLNNNASDRMNPILKKIDQLITNKLIFDNADGSMDPLRRRN
ncbi:MAG: serine hydrolase domain-containing protein [Saprospiraceae bacterium]